MENEPLKQAADKIVHSSRPSEKIIGAVFETYYKYLDQRTGQDGIKKVENEMANIGYPFHFKDIKPFDYVPLFYSVLLLVVAKEVFNWSEKDIFDMGHTAPQYSLIVRLIMRYFISIERTLEESESNWRKHFTKGEVSYELDKKDKKIYFRVKHNAMHPLTCVYAAGYFLRIFEYVIKSNNVKIEETKCAFKGSNMHEYLVSWD